MQQPHSEIRFANLRDIELAGILSAPDGPPRAAAVIAHCFTCTSDYRINRELARQLSRCGIASLRFDFTGLGGSGGDFSNTNFTTMVEDLRAAAEWLSANYTAPALLVGHSFGGTASLFAARELPPVKAVATIGSVADPSSVLRHFDLKLDEINTQGQAEVLLSGRRFVFKRQFVDDVQGQPWEDRIRNLGRALLVCHSPADEIVGIEHAAQLFQTARHPKSFLSLDNAGHLFEQPGSAEYAARVICAWASRYSGA